MWEVPRLPESACGRFQTYGLEPPTASGALPFQAGSGKSPVSTQCSKMGTRSLRMGFFPLIQ